MVAKNPYNLPENTERDVDQLTYNPRAEAGHDNAAFDPDRDSESAQPLGARGADNQSTGRNFAQEDMETERSEQTGQIPKGEVDDLLSSAPNTSGVSGRTRGNKVDAYKQERETDQFLKDRGITDADQDVTIGRATGV